MYQYSSHCQKRQKLISPQFPFFNHSSNCQFTGSCFSRTHQSNNLFLPNQTNLSLVLIQLRLATLNLFGIWHSILSMTPCSVRFNKFTFFIPFLCQFRSSSLNIISNSDVINFLLLFHIVVFIVYITKFIKPPQSFCKQESCYQSVIDYFP